MSYLRAILDSLNDIEATIARVSAGGQASEAVRLSLVSLETRRDMLREELSEVSKDEFVEVCDYRFIPSDADSYAVSGITTALHDFQDMISIVFDAITTKPKQRARLDADVVAKTTLSFGFAYAGSLGVVMTVPNERLFAVESHLDTAVSAVFTAMQSTSAEDIRNVATKYGAATLRKLYSWSKASSDHGLSAEIKWVRGDEVRSQVLVQPAGMVEICRLIEARSEDTVEGFPVNGALVSWNTVQRRFILDVPDADPISGTIAKTFDVSVQRTVPDRYRADLLKHTQIRYSEEEPRVTWELTGLSDPK